MVPFTSYFAATMSPGVSEGVNEYSWPHLGQKPDSRESLASQLEQRRLRSGTSPGTRAASGSCGGTGGRATRPAPKARRLLLPRLRLDVERVERTLRVLGVAPTPDPSRCPSPRWGGETAT